jgi:hypothetical protein
MCFEAIGHFSGLNGEIISSQACLADQPFRLRVRQPLLSEERKEWVAGLVRSRFRERSPILYPQLLGSLQYPHGIVICADTLHHLISNMG